MVYVQDVGSTTKLEVDIVWNGTNLVLNAANAPANGVVGLELYQSSAPNIQRQVFTVTASGTANGVLTSFRSNLSRTLRCSVVLSATTGGYKPNENVIIKLNGAIMPLVQDSTGNWAFQASF
jgi:hypothetical protein